jgi:hypothetical protein
MASNPYLILLDQATAEQIDAVHALMKENANGWWHHFSDAWIVFGKSSSEWRDIVSKCIEEGSASVLVIALPKDKASRSYAYYGTEVDKRIEWLKSNYNA